ncbi:MAG: TonB-dependent receptor [Flavobacteriaceae bacterium]|nr:TonB-dependent receptor [Flavobacteriaceae bacterium]
MKFIKFIILLLVGQFVHAQQLTVVDKDSGFPIQNVHVEGEDSDKRIISDKNGNIDLGVFSEMELLTFSHVSYVEFELLKKLIGKSNKVIQLQFKSEILNEVFLSATKGKENISRIAEQVAVFSSKEIQNTTPQTSADMLASIPGIKVQKTQFGGGSPVLRGMEANRILLVVDGVRMNNAIYRKGHLQNAITISPNILERVEVIFGPSSVIYGSDALGGVIHYYTRSPKTSEKTIVNSEFMSRVGSVNNEFTIQGGIEVQMKKWATYTSISRSKFGDLKMGKNRVHNFKDWGKQFEYSNNTDKFYNANAVINSNPETQRNVGFDQIDFLQKILIPINKKADIMLNMQYSNSTEINRFDKLTEYRDDKLRFAQWYYGPQKRLLLSTQLNLKLEKKWIDNGTITFAFQDIDESRINRRFDSFDRMSRFENVNVYSLNGDFNTNLKQSVNRNFSYGFELAYNDVKSKSKGEVLEVEGNEIIGVSDTFVVQTRYPDGGSSYISSAVYMDYRQDISKRSTLNTGIRLTNTQLQALWIDETFIKLPDNDIALKNTAVTLTAGYVFKPNKTWQLNGVLSSGFRSPNIDDIGKVREKRGIVTVPNVDLQPEFAYNFEAGTLKYFNDKNFYIGFTAYYTLLNNYIVRAPFVLNGSPTIIYDDEELEIQANVNNETAYILGGTFTLKGNITNNFQTKASFTYTKGRTYDTKEPMSSIPPIFGSLDLIYSKKKIETGLNFIFNGRKKLEDYNISEGIDNIEETPLILHPADADYYYGTPSWQTLNYYARYKATKNIDLLLAVDNIFDVHYKEFASAISAPGRNFSFTILGSF